MSAPARPTESTENATSPDRAAFAEEWQAWHRQKDETFAGPHGFLAITSLNWLDENPTRFPDAPGRWSSTAEGVTVLLDEGEELELDGEVLRGRHDFGVLAERASLYPAAGDAVFEVARRGGHDILRPRHPDSALRQSFTGTPAYDPDPRWAVPGRYEAFATPRPTAVGAVVEGLEHVYDAVGRIDFAVDGTSYALTAFEGGAPGTLHVLFTDATSGVTTYAANRSLSVAAPDADGNVTLDFNRATNLPCAYTDLATCPLPPAENRLPLAVEAGELIPTVPAATTRSVPA